MSNSDRWRFTVIGLRLKSHDSVAHPVQTLHSVRINILQDGSRHVPQWLDVEKQRRSTHRIVRIVIAV
ncbi:uncharacterized protein V6R79_011248 [Siganus canaliculatus]